MPCAGEPFLPRSSLFFPKGQMGRGTAHEVGGGGVAPIPSVTGFAGATSPFVLRKNREDRRSSNPHRLHRRKTASLRTQPVVAVESVDVVAEQGAVAQHRRAEGAWQG